MASISFVCSSAAKLDSIPFKPGQIIFIQDERAIYLDGTERTSYQQIITLERESDRRSLYVPLKGFYFIKETLTLWEYDGFDWTQITAPPTKQIVFDDKDNFPEIGDFDVLYIDGLKMYRYLNDTYQLINSGSGGGSIWVEI